MPNKLRFWLALGEHSEFSKEDKRMFYVFFASQKDNMGNPIQDHFVEAEDIEDARTKLKDLIDKTCDHATHMAKLESAPSKAERILKKKVVEIATDDQIDSLVIGDVVGRKKAEPIPNPTHNDLLDLKDLL